jgi:hypothetical protein
MAGPLSSNEIEDVVSSVRRLVSVDARPRPVSRDLGQDRLLLTPSLRVVPDPAPPLVLSVPAAEEAASPEPSAPAPEGAAEPALQLVEAEWEDEIWQEEGPRLAELALAVEEAEVVPAGEAPAAEPPETAAAPGPVAEAPWAQVDDDWVEADEPAHVIPLTWGTDPAAEAAGNREAAAKGREPETAAAAVPPAEPEPILTAAQGEAQTLVDGDGNPLTVLDEEALHEIVRSLIREELQGVLGERITRNVRKLVRAEINRALTARSLD